MDGALKYVSSGNDFVIGVNAAGQVFQRLGVSAASPSGTSWLQLDGNLATVDALGIRRNWGTNSGGNVFRA